MHLRDQPRRLAVVQTGHTIEHFPRVMHAFGAGLEGRKARLPAQVAERIAVRTDRLHHHRYRPAEPLQGVHQDRSFVQMVPADQHRAFLAPIRRKLGVLQILGHIYSQHQGLPFPLLFQPIPIDFVDFFAAINMLVHSGNTSSV